MTSAASYQNERHAEHDPSFPDEEVLLDRVVLGAEIYFGRRARASPSLAHRDVARRARASRPRRVSQLRNMVDIVGQDARP
jgi:hypothetical protein